MIDEKKLKTIEDQLTGSILYDDLHKALYATDASVYRKIPLAVAYPKNTDYLKIISPLHQVTAKSSPTLLFYGELDQLVPFSDGVELKKVLTSYNIKNELILFKGKHSEYWSTNFENKLSNFISKFLAIPN